MFRTTKVVGLNSDQQAAQALTSYGPGEDSDVCFLAIVYCVSEDAFIRGRQSLLEAETQFYASSEGLSSRLTNVYAALKQALLGVDDLSILVSCAQCTDQERTLYLISDNDFLQARLLRESSWIDLTSGVEKGQLISGFMEGNDRLFIFTRSLIDLMENNLGVLGKISLESIEDEITSRLPQAKVYPVALIALQVTVPQKENQENPLPLVSEQKVERRNILLPIVRVITQLLGIKQIRIILALLIVVGLAGGGFSFIKGRQNDTLNNEFLTHLNKAQEEYAKLSSLTPGDKVALEVLKLSEQEIKLALEVKPQDSSAQELQRKIEEITPDILKIYPINNFSLWLDFGLIKENFTAQKLILGNNQILALDTNQKVLVGINLTSKSQQTLAGGDKLGEAQIVAYTNQIHFVFGNDKGITKIDGGNLSLAVKKDDTWGKIIDVTGYGGNLYLLDGNKNQIWKYLPVASGYSDKRTYLQEGVRADFSQAIKIQIDSFVYVLRSDGKIYKFLSGATDNFFLTDLELPLNDPKSFYVSDSTDYLYILDSGNNRLVVTDKDGNYQSQYTSPEFAKFSDLLIDEENHKVYLLDGSKIYWMELNENTQQEEP